MTPQLNAYNVTISFFSHQFVTMTLPGVDVEDAKNRALEYASLLKDVTIVEAYDLSTVPMIKQLALSMAKDSEDQELTKILSDVEAATVIDPKDIN